MGDELCHTVVARAGSFSAWWLDSHVQPRYRWQPVDGSFIDTSDASALVQINKSKTEGGCLVASWLSVLVWNHQCGNRLNSLFPWCDSNVLFSFAGPQILCTFCGDRQATGPNAGAVHPRGQRHRSSRRRLHLPHRPRELCLQLWMSQGTTICMFRPVSFFFFFLGILFPT